ERLRRIQVNGAIEIGPVLVYVVGSEKESLEEFTFCAEGHDLAARIHQLVRIIRQQIEVQPKSRKLFAIKIGQAGADRDITSRKLAGGNRAWVDVDWKTRSNEARRKPDLARSGRIRRQPIEPIDEITGDSVRADLRVIHRVAAANRSSRVSARIPAKADARREVGVRVGERLAVITQSEIEREIAAQVNVVLHEDGVEPLRQVVAVDTEVNWLRVVLHVGKRQLAERRGGSRSERERAEDRGARLAAGSTRAMMNDTAAETQVVFAERPRHRVGELHLMSPET